jgi:EAL domain-containing protein (putative c-di-GMP-specific phosphodiesterase class I)
MPAAENTGLIIPLTQLVINDALAAVRAWRAQGLEITVSVNVTARHIANLDLPNQVTAALEAHELPGSVLVVEVTESCLMADPVRTGIVLGRLRDAGVHLSIDDFGTGYSSFANLRDLPVSEIKIDRSFVSAATGSAANAAIVKSTVDLGHNLGLAVVAEGVETVECLQLLTDMGCDLIQGYLFSPAMPGTEVLAWSAARNSAAQDGERIEAAC